MSTGFAESGTNTVMVPQTEEPLYEIVRGERVELPPMSVFASLIAGRLFNALDSYLGGNELGTAAIETLMILDPASNLRRRPDVAFVGSDRWPLEREIPLAGDWDVVPTIAIEVTSPHDGFDDVHAKVLEYFDHGVVEVWVVYPAQQQVYQYTSPTDAEILDETRVLKSEQLLPEFEIALQELFRRQVRSATFA